MQLIWVVLLTASVLAEAKTAKSRSSDDQKKQNPFEDMQFPDYGGDDLDIGGSIDFVCEHFCSQPESSDNGTEELMREILELKSQIAAQTNTLTEIQQTVSNSGSGSTDLVPKEYKPAYPVFHMQSDWGRYQYTFESAKDACESRGGKLATYKQLLAAWERGLDLCQCGWIEEGFAAYPIQYPRQGCVDKIGPGIRYDCTWQSTWNAWCFNKDVANKLP